MPDPSDSRPAALLVTRNFPPLLGGMEKLNRHLLAELAGEWRPVLCGPAGCAKFAPPGTVVAETGVKPLPRFLAGVAMRSIALARRLRPAVVVAGSGLTAPVAWIAARLVGAKAVVYLHGLDIVAPSRVYQWVWLPFVRACDMALVNSRNTGALALASGVRADRIHVLNPGTHIPALVATAGTDFRNRHALGERPVMLSVGRLTARKGLAEWITSSLPAILAKRPDALLLVIGDEASNALHAGPGSERERIIESARAVGATGSVRLVGHCSDAELGAAYQAAQVHVFPVLAKPGDVEGFGMVATEAAAHGLPTVAFSVGGVPDAIQDPDSGRLVATGDYRAFADAVLDLLAEPRNEQRVQACRRFAAEKDWVAFGGRLRALLRELIRG